MTPITTSLCDIYKIGPGPSSSHTIAPMRAGYTFRSELQALLEDASNQSAEIIQVVFYGSLSATGKGHSADSAVRAGLSGYPPEKCPPHLLAELSNSTKPITIQIQEKTLTCTPENIIFSTEKIDSPYSNTMDIQLCAADKSVLHSQRYYSVGGGFLEWDGYTPPQRGEPVHPYSTMNELKHIVYSTGMPLHELLLENEKAITGMTEDEVMGYIDTMLNAMWSAVKRGIDTEGVLPGPIGLNRKASRLFKRASRGGRRAQQLITLLCAYAFAAAEENADGEPVVTAPTCGSCGVLPAITYVMSQHQRMDKETIRRALIAACSVSFLAKHNASIAGADVGCQGEIGVASSMAAAVLAYAHTSDVRIMENAAQTALEHHLGMTCDPVEGYVQVPCIERNSIGALTAYGAFTIASVESPHHHLVDLDSTIQAMNETGRDMHCKYRETAEGGLARTLKKGIK